MMDLYIPPAAAVAALGTAAMAIIAVTGAVSFLRQVKRVSQRTEGKEG